MPNREDDFDASFEKYPRKKKVDLSYEEYDSSKDKVIKKNIEKKVVSRKEDTHIKQPPIQKRPSNQNRELNQKKIVRKQLKKKQKYGFGARIKDFFEDAGIGEYLVIFTTVIIIIAAGIILFKWEASKEKETGVEALIPIGQQLSEVAVHSDVLVDTIIASFLGGQEANKVLANLDESVEITATFSSIMRDLKVKFVNKETDALIDGILFKIEIIPPTGDSILVTDENKDGMIYVRDLEPGAYQVICKSVGNVKFSDTPVDVAVKDQLEYQEINIINEVKKESEINVAVEDTAVQEAVVESKLQDTVAWVASTKTAVGDGSGYVEVLKDTITDPSKVASLESAFYKVSTVTNTPTQTPTPTVTATPTVTPTVTVTPTPLPPTYEISVPPISAGDKDKGVEIKVNNLPENQRLTFEWKIDDDSAGIDNRVLIPDAKLTTEGTQIKISCVITRRTDDTNDTLLETKTVTKTITVGPSNDISVTLDKKEATISRTDMEKLKLEATVKKAVSKTDVTWTSSDSKIATVDTTGVVTPVGGGEAIITATTVEAKASDINTYAKATCTVTVSPLTIKITSATVGGKTPESIYVGSKVVLTADFTNRLSTDKITWMTSDATLGTITKNTISTSKDVYTFEALKEGTVNITVESADGLGKDNKKVSVVYQFIVSVDPKKDTTTKLNDNNGTQVYVKDGTEYREAKYADFYTYTKFYVKGAVEYTYTGWQTMADNKTYYFDKKGEKVTGTQVIQGVTYVFSSAGVLSMGDGIIGIDVSKWNGTIDWAAVKASGVNFVIIRCGYRGSTTGSLIVDPKFEQNIQGATNAGLKVGVYFFTQAITEVEAVEEASLALALTSKYKLTYPIFIDSEGSGGRADGLDVTTRTAVLKAFCQTITNAGKKAGIYASKNWYGNKLTMSQLNAYTIWMAQYATAATYTGRYDIWQYSSSGHVGGIEGNVDMNKSYLNY